MVKISMGRRLLMALPTSIVLGLIMWIIGSMAITVMPNVFPTLFPETCATVGFASGMAEQLVADFHAKKMN